MLKKLASLAFAAAFLVGCAQSKSPDAAAPGSGSNSSSNKVNAQSKDELIVGLSLSTSDPSSDPDAKYNCSTKRIKFVKYGVFMHDLTNIKVNDWHTFSELEEDLSLKRGDASGGIAMMKSYAEKMCEGVDIMAEARKAFNPSFDESKKYGFDFFATCAGDYRNYGENFRESWIALFAESSGINWNHDGLRAGLEKAIKKYPDCRLEQLR